MPVPLIPLLRPITRLREPWRTDEREVGLDRGQRLNTPVPLIVPIVWDLGGRARDDHWFKVNTTYAEGGY